MDRARLTRILDQLAPHVEGWLKQDAANRALAREVAAWLEDAAKEPTTAPAAPPAAPRPSRQDLIDRMIADYEMMSGLAGGLSKPPLGAPGVSLPIPPPAPAPVRAGPSRTAAQARPAPASPVPPLSHPASASAKAAGRTDSQRLAMQKVHYHLGQIAKCMNAKDHAAAALHTSKVVESIDAFTRAGGDAGDEEARAALTLALEAAPHKALLPVATEKLIESLLRRMDASEEEGEKKEDGVRARCVEMLRGTVVVLVGGEVREDRRKALEAELELEELRWVRSTPTNPALKFEAELKRPEVAVVLIAIRWVRHHLGYAVAEACTKHEKPLVRLRGGLGTNSIAAAVIDQAGDWFGST